MIIAETVRYNSEINYGLSLFVARMMEKTIFPLYQTCSKQHVRRWIHYQLFFAKSEMLGSEIQPDIIVFFFSLELVESFI